MKKDAFMLDMKHGSSIKETLVCSDDSHSYKLQTSYSSGDNKLPSKKYWPIGLLWKALLKKKKLFLFRLFLKYACDFRWFQTNSNDGGSEDG